MDETAKVLEALIKAQAHFPIIPRSKTVTIKPRDRAAYTFSYAPLDEILSLVRKPLAEAGLAVYQETKGSTTDNYMVHTHVIHNSGQRLTTTYPVILESSSGPKGFAAAVTYARRYGLSLALGLAPTDDLDGETDDDEIVSIKPEKMPEAFEKAATLQELSMAFSEIDRSQQADFKPFYQQRREEIKRKAEAGDR